MGKKCFLYAGCKSKAAFPICPTRAVVPRAAWTRRDFCQESHQQMFRRPTGKHQWVSALQPPEPPGIGLDKLCTPLSQQSSLRHCFCPHWFLCRTRGWADPPRTHPSSNSTKASSSADSYRIRQHLEDTETWLNALQSNDPIFHP